MHEYLNENKLKLNIEKTKYMYMILRNKIEYVDDNTNQVMINNEKIEK